MPPYKRRGPLLSLFKFALVALCSFFLILGVWVLVSVGNLGDARRPVKFQNLRAETSLSQKVEQWTKYLQQPMQNLAANSRFGNLFQEFNRPAHPVVPDFWTPIDITIGTQDATLEMCQLNWNAYHKEPHAYPMFKDLVAISHCGRGRSRTIKLSEALKEVEQGQGPAVVAPSMFVFHESRVGSTLVANLLASDPYSMVFSESTPPAKVFLHCTRCSRERQVKLMQDLIKIMGRSPFHRSLFFKLQSATVQHITVMLEAFPETPWTFVFREPVQVLMSHLDPSKGGGTPVCLRSRGNGPAPDAVQQSLKLMNAHPKSASREEYCGAHLFMLCKSALEAFLTHGKNSQGRPRALLIDYDALPGAVPRVLLPAAGRDVDGPWLEAMVQEADFYSKNRGMAKVFSGDSQAKELKAWGSLRRVADAAMRPVYSQLLEAGISVMRAWDSDASVAGRMLLPKDTGLSTALFLQALKSFPSDLQRPSMVTASKGAMPQNMAPMPVWNPFATTHNSLAFEHVECPPTPANGYPKEYLITNLTNNWPIDSTDIPAMHYNSICYFDYQTEYDKALAYRDAEVPFIVYNIPDVEDTVKRWSNLDYLQAKLGRKTFRTETSVSNHFMYWRSRTGGGKGWKPPTGVVHVTFEQWMREAVTNHNKTLEERKHLYFRVSDDAAPWLVNEIPIFKPVKSLFLVDPKEQRGIHCRFGMRSVIAENHFDGSRNMVAMLGGLRRWILSHPENCDSMYLYDNRHPSGRHSEVDWSAPDLVKFPKFVNLRANEVILKPGDVLYVPTHWFHYIVSINVNWQCNSRSGVANTYRRAVAKCGF